MTVKELKSILSGMPNNAHVVIPDNLAQMGCGLQENSYHIKQVAEDAHCVTGEPIVIIDFDSNTPLICHDLN